MVECRDPVERVVVNLQVPERAARVLSPVSEVPGVRIKISVI